MQAEISFKNGYEFWIFSNSETPNINGYKAILSFHQDEFYNSTLKKEMIEYLSGQFEKNRNSISRNDFEQILKSMMSEIPSSYASNYFYDNISFGESLKRFENENECKGEEIIFLEFKGSL